jgi:hypothetical protein
MPLTYVNGGCEDGRGAIFGLHFKRHCYLVGRSRRSASARLLFARFLSKRCAADVFQAQPAGAVHFAGRWRP